MMLDGKRVLVTAAASGIGATVAARMAEAGARVYVCDSDEAVLRAYLRDHPGIGGGVADVAAPGDVEATRGRGARRTSAGSTCW